MQNMDTFVIVMYIAIILFFGYRLIKTQRDKKKLVGEVSEFKRPNTSFEIILFAVLVATGVLNLYMGYKSNNTNSMITAVVMIILSIVFVLSARSKFYVAENGLIANSQFYNYKELKKWGFDTKSKDLILKIKKDKKESNELIKVKDEDMNKINTLIRRYKLNK